MPEGIPTRPVQVGERFGLLVVVEEEPERVARRRVFRCACDCGREKRRVAGSELRRGRPRSCGCQDAAGVTFHRHKTAKGPTPTYNTWMAMKQRCLDIHAENYPRYGGRGVSICARWLQPKRGFANFLADMGKRPTGKTLDRINPEGDYEPSNCRWATPKEQRANRRPS